MYIAGISNMVGDVSLNNRLFVFGDSSFNGNLYTNGSITSNRLFTLGDVSFGNNMYVTGKTTIGGDASLNTRLFVNGDASLNGNLFVNKDISLNGNLYANNNIIINSAIAISKAQTYDVSSNLTAPLPQYIFVSGNAVTLTLPSMLSIFAGVHINIQKTSADALNSVLTIQAPALANTIYATNSVTGVNSIIVDISNSGTSLISDGNIWYQI